MGFLGIGIHGLLEALLDAHSSRPMMPPPRMSIRLGTSFKANAPVLSTTRGALGMKGRRTAWHPAAMMAFLN